jgi:hypothetical protein
LSLEAIHQLIIISKMLSGAKKFVTLPIYAARTDSIKYLIGANALMFGYYYLSPGPTRMQFNKNFTVSVESNFSSVLLHPLGHTNALNLAFTSGVLYTFGQYHVAKYGLAHFGAVFGLGSLAAGALAAAAVTNGTDSQIGGSMGGVSSLLFYHLFKNPRWFSRFNPYAFLFLLALYGAQYGDRAVYGGITAGTALFMVGL